MKINFISLGEVAEFINGAAFKPEDWGDIGLKIIRIQNLTDPTKPYNCTKKKVSDKLYVNYGDILVSWSASLGVFVWNKKEKAVLNQHIFRVIPNEKIVDKNYLRHCLHGAIIEMSKHLHGATMQHVNRGAFLSTKIHLPPLPEQKRIAEILDQANQLRKKRRQSIEQLNELKQSIFLDMFGDPMTNPNRWKSKKLFELTTKITDGTHKTPKYQESGVIFLSAKNVKDGELNILDPKYISASEHYELCKRCKPEYGDIVLTKSGSLGDSAIIKFNFEFSIFESLALIKPKKEINIDFLHSFLTNDQIKLKLLGATKGISIRHIHLVDIREISILTPPFSLQQDFSNKINNINKMKKNLKNSLKNLNDLFSSLQHLAFKGELSNIDSVESITKHYAKKQNKQSECTL